jgi:DedD protein
MADPADINVDELRRRARRRLVGAVVLALGVAVVVPMLLETEQKPLGEDVSVKIPPIDDGKFVNRLSENRAKDGAGGPAKAPTKGEPSKDMAAPAAPPLSLPTAPPKYDTRLPETPAGGPPATSGAPATDASNITAPGTSEGKPSVQDKSASESPAPAASTPPAPRTDAKASPPTASVQPQPATVAAAAPAAKAAPAPPHEGFAVQLAAFADDKGANALAGRLKKSGYAAYTEPLKTSKGTLWRVRVGPYPSREAAVTARDKLKTEGQSGIVAAIK